MSRPDREHQQKDTQPVTDRYIYLHPDGDLGGDTWDVWYDTQTGETKDFASDFDPNAA